MPTVRRLFLALAAAAPLFAQVCSYTTSPDPTQPIGVLANGTPGATIIVTTASSCPWSYYTDSKSWIGGPTDVPNSQIGSGSFTWTAGANTLQSARQGKIFIVTNNGSITYTISQAAQVCTVSLPVSSASIAAAGATGTVQIQTNCVWAAGSNQNWITLAAPTSGALNGSVGFTVAANGCVASRTGAVSVQAGAAAGPTQQFQITQTGSPGNLTISPTTLTVPQAGLDGGLTVTTGTGCSWIASSDVSWIQITGGAATGNGSGGVAFHIPANTGPSRAGNIHVGAATLAVTQQAAPAPTPQLTAVANGASYVQGSVSPGEIVALFGVNLGPTPGVPLQLSADGKSITKTLGGVQVLFDGNAAPLTYASATQVNAVVPYGVAGASSTQVQVQYQGTVSNTINLSVEAATPGIFALDGSGTGGGAILNQDYSRNEIANPAPRGSVVMIYCTGGGVTSPASIDGAITGLQLPELVTSPVSVTIGGMTAPVSYSGGVPSSIAGLTQINAQVPNGVAPGQSLPVVVRIGNRQSQSGITITVQ
jgi:uncharacterized protein (TIGR03437 family)